MKETIKQLEKEIEKSKKCKMCIQLNEDFGTDCPKHMESKTKLQTLKDVCEEINEIDFEDLIERHTWYPDDLDSPRQIKVEQIKEELLKKFQGEEE